MGDVDGDGVYELFVKWDPSNSKDNSQKGKTGNVYIDCYKLTGEKLWRIDMGKKYPCRSTLYTIFSGRL
ncbi:MAG: hypothetical protein ACLR1Q_05060 [Ruminococcus sp.]